MKLPPCPHCKASAGVYRNVRAYGWCEEFFDEYGKQSYITNDGLQFSDGKKFYCEDCGQVRKDIKIEEINRVNG
jgi:hypothetical protein